MNGFVAPTDHGWYEYLRIRPELEEINFWRPGGSRFAALELGEPFFFKLKAPHHAIGGFGHFAGYMRMPLWMAWEAFGEANGVPDPAALQARLARLSSAQRDGLDVEVGCITLVRPVFFGPDDWAAVPADWRPNIVSGRRYDLGFGHGQALWEACLDRDADGVSVAPQISRAAGRPRYGASRMVSSRLGQAAFRLAVQEAYRRACAVTAEHPLPALEAAHIRPYGDGGSHDVSNGILLRRDLHRLFDLGLVTVRPDGIFTVSRRLRADPLCGHAYRTLHGRPIALPRLRHERPDRDALQWHADVIFAG